MFELKSKRNSTDFITVDTRNCTACGDCVAACGLNVLAIKGPFFHCHIHVVNRVSCIGCMKCAKACDNNVFIRKRLRQNA